MFGAAIAIFCSLIWSTAIILFKKTGDSVHPILLNLFKNSVGLLLFIPTLLILYGPHLPDISLNHWLILLASGALGIGLADAMVLKALNEAGASRLAIIECSYSPFVIFLSLFFLGEQLSWGRACGAVFVLLAILCVSVTRESFTMIKGPAASGLLWGLFGLFMMAGGIVMVKPLFAAVPLFWIIAIRLAAGVAASAAIFAGLPAKRTLLRALRHIPEKKLMMVACVMSTYLSMMLWVAGYKYNDAALAAVLNQTSTIFTVVLAAVVLKEKFTPLKAAGTALAMAGVVIMAFG